MEDKMLDYYGENEYYREYPYQKVRSCYNDFKSYGEEDYCILAQDDARSWTWWIDRYRKVVRDPVYVVSELTGVRPEVILRQPLEIVHAKEKAILEKHFQEIADGKPLAYIMQRVNFYGRNFYVNENVLIPRPETELVVDQVFAELKAILVTPTGRYRHRKTRILDVGTGSGCIAATIAAEMPDTIVTAIDISSEALQVAKKNCDRLVGPGRVKLMQGDLMSEILEESKKKLNQDYTFDIVVANLPYLSPDWQWLDKKKLGFEPELALYSDGDGTGLIKKLISQYNEYHMLYHDQFVTQQPKLILELDPSEMNDVAAFVDFTFCRPEAAFRGQYSMIVDPMP